MPLLCHQRSPFFSIYLTNAAAAAAAKSDDNVPYDDPDDFDADNDNRQDWKRSRVA